MKAPCPHCEHTKIRGNVADVAPMWPQFGQTIRVSMSVASAGACARQEQVQNFPQLNACPHSLRAAASDSLAMLAAIRRVVADQELKPQPVFPRLRYRRHRDQHSRCRRPAAASRTQSCRMAAPWPFAARTGDACIVEEDYGTPLRKPVRHKRIPIVQAAAEVLKEDERRSSLRAEAPVCVTDSASFDEPGWSVMWVSFAIWMSLAVGCIIHDN
jgi:hypothetical protein